MNENEVKRAIHIAMESHDVLEAERLFSQFPDMLRASIGAGTWLHAAANYGSLEIVQLLVRLGLDVNAPLAPGNAPEGPLRDAVQNNHIHIVRWLLEHGASSNCVQDGDVRNFALQDAAFKGNLEIVRLLVEHGADVNATWMMRNPLSSAIAGGNKEVILYLLSKGAKDSWQLTGKPPEDALPVILAHMTENLGKPLDTSLQEDDLRDPPILVHFIPPAGKQKRVTLFTSGMSNKPMKSPPGELNYQFAELYMHLPPDWPTAIKKLNDPKYRWPIDWLRTIAHRPHDTNDWLGGRFSLVANGEPPEPLASKVPFTAFLLATSDSELEMFWPKDKRQCHFYIVIPIYTEEYELARREDPEVLLKLFQKHKISQTYDPKRLNVATKGKK